MIITLEDGTRYEVSGTWYRVGGGEWKRWYTLDAHPLRYEMRKLSAGKVGYTEPKPGLFLTMLVHGGEENPDSPIATVVP